MKTPAQWLAEQIGDRPDDFAPEESPVALAFIKAIQRDAIEAAVADVEGTATFWDEDDQPALEDAIKSLREMLTEETT